MSDSRFEFDDLIHVAGNGPEKEADDESLSRFAFSDLQKVAGTTKIKTSAQQVVVVDSLAVQAPGRCIAIKILKPVRGLPIRKGGVTFMYEKSLAALPKEAFRYATEAEVIVEHSQHAAGVPEYRIEDL